jgi:hypothetical protein
MWVSVSRLVREEYGVADSRSADYLRWVQTLLDDDVIDGAVYANQALGCVLGVILVENIDGLDWCAFSDAQGRDLCLRYRDTSLTIFPLDMVLKRCEAGDAVNLPELYSQTKRRVEELAQQASRVS